MQNLRDLAWTTVYFALLGCTAPVLEALYVNAAELDRTKERVRQTLHRHLGLSHFKTLERGPRGIYFPERSRYDFQFYVYEGPVPTEFNATMPMEFLIGTYDGQLSFCCRRSGPWRICSHSQSRWFSFLESDLDLN